MIFSRQDRDSDDLDDGRGANEVDGRRGLDVAGSVEDEFVLVTSATPNSSQLELELVHPDHKATSQPSTCIRTPNAHRWPVPGGFAFARSADKKTKSQFLETDAMAATKDAKIDGLSKKDLLLQRTFTMGLRMLIVLAVTLCIYCVHDSDNRSGDGGKQMVIIPTQHMALGYKAKSAVENRLALSASPGLLMEAELARFSSRVFSQFPFTGSAWPESEAKTMQPHRRCLEHSRPRPETTPAAAPTAVLRPDQPQSRPRSAMDLLRTFMREPNPTAIPPLQRALCCEASAASLLQTILFTMASPSAEEPQPADELGADTDVAVDAAHQEKGTVERLEWQPHFEQSSHMPRPIIIITPAYKLAEEADDFSEFDGQASDDTIERRSIGKYIATFGGHIYPAIETAIVSAIDLAISLGEFARSSASLALDAAMPYVPTDQELLDMAAAFSEAAQQSYATVRGLARQHYPAARAKAGSWARQADLLLVRTAHRLNQLAALVLVKTTPAIHSARKNIHTAALRVYDSAQALAERGLALP